MARCRRVEVSADLELYKLARALNAEKRRGPNKVDEARDRPLKVVDVWGEGARWRNGSRRFLFFLCRGGPEAEQVLTDARELSRYARTHVQAGVQSR